MIKPLVSATPILSIASSNIINTTMLSTLIATQLSAQTEILPEKVMSRTEWFKFLKLAFDELVCEYPTYLSAGGIVFVPPSKNQVENPVDCVDKDLLI